MFPREPTGPDELDRGPNPLGRRISKEGVGEAVIGSAVYWASHWVKEVQSEVMERGGPTEILLALEKSWERVEDTLGRTLLSTESLVRRRPAKAMDGGSEAAKEMKTMK